MPIPWAEQQNSVPLSRCWTYDETRHTPHELLPAAFFNLPAQPLSLPAYSGPNAILTLPFCVVGAAALYGAWPIVGVVGLALWL